VKLLLDTHIWIWAVNSPGKLSRRVQREIQRTNNQLYLSPISIWEAHHLARRGRFRLRQTVPEWIEQLLASIAVHEAPLTFQIAAAAALINLPQPDPGDVLLAATASVLDLTLVTTDSQLLGCSWLKTLPNN